jgi:hypothetical protein
VLVPYQWEEKRKAEMASQSKKSPKKRGERHWKRSSREVWIHPATGATQEREDEDDVSEASSSASFEKLPRSQVSYDVSKTRLSSFAFTGFLTFVFQLIKDFTNNFLVVHGMLFTKVK